MSVNVRIYYCIMNVLLVIFNKKNMCRICIIAWVAICLTVFLGQGSI